ncbi:P-type conjugative transfer protein TrbL [Gluconacetobacter aggeris]|uniref:P-type conjugative transfer protein TrbL n=1 Tax=Gluconacetobacter aggeris TaxID=1286186 RepID=A0A7W4NVY8_9PROT|nr:P-type conjugative transfer protein TrbL [Gluconacetobacter aggeris]MBB2168132.1 P-type conjugative transfer protein TrbL [Gluconacetobacter aggeris]
MASDNVGIIDGFLNTFETTIDSGFGLVRGSVVSLAGSLSVMDIVLAGLFWAWAADEDIVQRLVKKTLYIGFFAFVIDHFSGLSGIVFNSFAALGLKAGGGTLALGDFMHPGRLAATGLDAAQPLLDAASKLAFSFGALASIVQILVLLLCWFIVLAAFFILAVQLFVAIVEFKLTSLAGFVLIPFALFNRTAFLAEKVLGNVVSSGVKIMVLAVISAIASVLFRQFTTSSYGDSAPTIGQALSVVLASLCIVGLAIFGGSLANGLISGAPQLGAGAAAGTAMAVGAMGAAAVAAPAAVASGGAAALGATAAAARGGAAVAGAATTAYSMGAAGQTGAAGMASAAGNVGRAAGGTAVNAVKSKVGAAGSSLKESYSAGGRWAAGAMGGSGESDSPSGDSGSSGSSGGGDDPGTGPTDSGGGPSGGGPNGGDGSDGKPPRWAQKMKRRNAATHAAEAAHIIRSADGGGGSASIDLSEKE